MDHQERYSRICLALFPHIGAERFAALVGSFGSAHRAWSASADEIARLLPQVAGIWQKRRGEAEQAAEAALRWAEQDGCRLLLCSDTDFPALLSEGMTPPPLLFARGRTALLNAPALAVVGSRHATPQAMQTARDFARALSDLGICTVSGMASGIDTAAHQGALQGQGGSIAVWGTGIDRIYPAANQALARQLASDGLILSEFPLGTRPLAGNFPRRNRIIAALSLGVLVVEAAVESGSLITARLAGEMGREVMAVPGSVHNPHSKGCHKLIKEGAKLTECLEDILSECPGLLQNARSSAYSINKETLPTAGAAAENRPSENGNGISDGLDAALLQAMGYDPVHPDMLAERLAMPADAVYAALLEWELAGTVAALPGGRYQRTGSLKGN